MFTSVESIIICTPAKGISIQGRNTPRIQIMNIKPGDKVAGMARIKAETAAEKQLKQQPKSNWNRSRKATENDSSDPEKTKKTKKTKKTENEIWMKENNPPLKFPAGIKLLGRDLRRLDPRFWKDAERRFVFSYFLW